MASDARIDSLDIWGATLGLADQIETARRTFAGIAGDLPPADGVRNVVVMGMGGSGMAGDIAELVGERSGSVPIVAVKSYECPAWVDERTLAVAVSFSGGTEETVSAARMAVERGARLVAVATGGDLSALAGDVGGTVVGVDGSIPMPRSGVGAVAVPVLLALDRLGLVRGVDGELDAVTTQLRARRADYEADDSMFVGLARRLARSIPLVYGAGTLGGIAARRWKNQFNENPNAPAFCGVLSEITHNELQGWGLQGDVTRQVIEVVELRHDHEHPMQAHRFDFMNRVLDEVVHDTVEVRAAGGTPLAQLFDLVFVGDVVALLVAEAEEVDPGPIPALEDLKQYLRDAADDR